MARREGGGTVGNGSGRVAQGETGRKLWRTRAAGTGQRTGGDLEREPGGEGERPGGANGKRNGRYGRRIRNTDYRFAVPIGF